MYPVLLKKMVDLRLYMYNKASKIAVFPLTRTTLYQTADSVKVQNKNVKHRPSTKHQYFHKITDPTLFFSREKIEKKNLPTDQLFMLVETQLLFLRLSILMRVT